MADILVNRVANSGLVTLKLEDYYPTNEIIHFDLKDYLFQGLILKEKDFRTALKEYDWSSLNETTLLVYCSTDAIIPVWAYMLVASYAAKFTDKVYQLSETEYLKKHFSDMIASIDISEYEGQKMVIKGCSDKPVPPSAYLDIMTRLEGIAQSVMYGEPCSTVPVYKRPKI